jgi:hypothetical protein
MILEAHTTELPQIKPLLIAGVSRCPLLKHYGSDVYLPEKVLPVKNDKRVKPKKEGGVWTSPVDSEWGWKDWNEGEQFAECDEGNSFTVCLNENAKILVIDSLDDLKNAPLTDGYSKRVFDFERTAKKYDAIWLTAKGQNATQFSHPLDLCGWDCETVLILNPNCCTAVS